MKKFKVKRAHAAKNRNYTIDYKNELNSAQYKAVTSLEGPHLVIAGAGSGKTRTLIYRVAYMVENGIEPKSILLLTFTRKSAQEMMRRAATILDDRCRQVAGGTFHSFANLILRKYALEIKMVPTFTIVDRGDAEDIINLIRSDMKLNTKDRRFPRKSTILSMISKSVNKCISIEEVVMDEYHTFAHEIEELTLLAEKYHKFKEQKQVMDYDDLLVKLRLLLRQSDDVRKIVSGTYKYIMVDEYQDTNRLQADITALLSSEHNNIMAVGDDSQSIYSFRGADFRNIMEFPNIFPGAALTTLEQNYRSTKPILDLTNAIIEQAKVKYSKELFSDIEGVDKPIYFDLAGEDEQAAFIVQQVLDLREEGIPLDNMAVLFRAGWHSNHLELELKKANIPYSKFGGLKFAEAAHVKDVMAYMRVQQNIFDEIAWMRQLLLLPGIGPATASRVIAKMMESGGSLDALIHQEFEGKKFFQYLQDLHSLLAGLMGSGLLPAERMELIQEYYKPIFRDTYDDYRRRQEDLKSILEISKRYGSLEELLTDMALEPPTTYQEGVATSEFEDEKLVLSTVHSAKGLEWHSVFVMHLVNGFFPASRSMDTDEGIEEERRLFYVATTRAKRNLYLLKPELERRAWNDFDPAGLAFSEPSMFVTEIHNFHELAEAGELEFEEDPF